MTSSSSGRNPDWVTQALQLPIRFAQVREDPILDMGVVSRLKPDSRVLVVASGGCTVCALATMPAISHMTVVDPNPSQIAITRTKLHMHEHYAREECLRLLGHQFMDPHERSQSIGSLLAALEFGPNELGPNQVLTRLGIDFVGRYESVFHEISKGLVDFDGELEVLLSLSNIETQKRKLRDMSEFRERLLFTMQEVMDLANLVALFGEEATRNRVQPFASHFFDRVVWALEHLPADSNTFLWQVLRNQCPPGKTVPWLGMRSATSLPSMNFQVCLIQEYLQHCDEHFDYIHLSNVLDWLSPDEASNLLEATWNRLAKNGFTLIRQLNSNLDIPSLNSNFEWLTNEAKAMYDSDRSFFYRAIHLARK